MMMLLHGGGAPLHHLWAEWELDPAMTLPLAASAVLYGAGVRVLWRLGVNRGIRVREVCCFAAGWVVLAFALLSPLHALSEQVFSAHMVQHELMMVVAAPLLVLGRPLVPWMWALPHGARMRVGAVAASQAWRSGWSGISRPLGAWVLHASVLWVWHLPALFQATLFSNAAHALQHVSFLGVALSYWWSVLHHRRAAAGAAVVSLFTTLVITGALGALLTFARGTWYPEYAARGALWGFTPLEDQQLAGLIMWIPASTSYVVAGLTLLALWLRQSEMRVALYERGAAMEGSRS